MELLQSLKKEGGEGGKEGERLGGWGEREREDENQQKASKSAFRSRPEALATQRGDLEVTSDWLTSQEEWCALIGW